MLAVKTTLLSFTGRERVVSLWSLGIQQWSRMEVAESISFPSEVEAQRSS